MSVPVPWLDISSIMKRREFFYINTTLVYIFFIIDYFVNKVFCFFILVDKLLMKFNYFTGSTLIIHLIAIESNDVFVGSCKSLSAPPSESSY